MTKKVLMNIMVWGESGTATMNTNGELIHTMRVRKTYYLWGIPFLRTTDYLNGTHDELKERKRTDELREYRTTRVGVSTAF
ncbi:MAG: hypothetical protein HOG49_13075 [Candidatus Scalindua sp.]|jgi:hypothetical protein|nr:hypothetical protein [Candidatus Scalindua sp.]